MNGLHRAVLVPVSISFFSPPPPSFSLSHIPVRGLPNAPRNVGFIKLFDEGASSPLFNAPASPETLSLHILPRRWIVMESCGEAAMEE